MARHGRNVDLRIANRTAVRVGVATVAAGGFRTLDDTADPTFNQLLGVNDNGLIAGYFGSGAQGHPNMGYLLDGASYQGENFPGSVQTQVTGLNNRGVTVGFWSNTNMGGGHGRQLRAGRPGNTDGFLAAPAR